MKLSIKTLPFCWKSLCWVSSFIHCYAEYHYAECRCAECRDLFIVTLNVIMLSVVMLSVVAPSKKAPTQRSKCLVKMNNFVDWSATCPGNLCTHVSQLTNHKIDRGMAQLTFFNYKFSNVFCIYQCQTVWFRNKNTVKRMNNPFCGVLRKYCYS